MRLFTKWLTWLVVVVLLAFQFVIVPPTAVYACSCIPPGPTGEELERVTAVFAGKVTQIEEPEGLFISSADPVQITFQVSEVWKGSVNSTQLARTPLDSASCGNAFMMEQEYLVYASGSKADLEVWLCSRTTPIATAADDLLALGIGEIPSSNTNDQQVETIWISSIFTIILGLLMVLAGLFMPQLNRKLGIPERSQTFNTPRFQISARQTEIISQAVMILLGLGFMLRGVGGSFYPHAIVDIIAWGLLGLAFLGIFTMIAITIFNWRAEE